MELLGLSQKNGFIQIDSLIAGKNLFLALFLK